MRFWCVSLALVCAWLPAVAQYTVTAVHPDGVVAVTGPTGDRLSIKPWGAEFPGREHREGWQHVFGLGAVDVEIVERFSGDVMLAKVTVAGIPAERLLLAQGSALPVPGQTDRIGARYADSAKRLGLGVQAEEAGKEESGGEGTLGAPPPPPPITLQLIGQAMGGRSWVAPISGDVGVVNDPARPLTLVVDVLESATTIAETVEIEAAGLPGPNSLMVDQRPYTPVMLARYTDLVLQIETDQGLRCRSLSGGAGLTAGAVFAVIDGRVLLLDGSAEAPLVTITARPDGVGQLITLHSNERNVECGEVDTQFPPFDVDADGQVVFKDSFESR